jgi:hypothetical protein
MARLAEPDRIALQIYEAAAREHAATNNERRFGRTGHKRYLGMSQIGGPCERKLWYDFRSFTPKPFDGRLGLLFDDGDHYEAKIIKYLRLAGYRLEHTGRGDQLEFRQFDGLFCGHADGVIHGVTHRPHILECKSANRSKFTSFQRFGVRQTYPAYYSQCQCYMGYADLDRALVVVYCKDSSEIYSERLRFNRLELQALEERALRVITANEPPERAFTNSDVMECQWCDFHLHCWTDEGVIMAEDRVCGSCWYFCWQGLTKVCGHPDHPYEIQTWGIGCDEWSYLFDKEWEGRPLSRKPRVAQNTCQIA